MKLTRYCSLELLRTFSWFRSSLKETRRYPTNSAHSNIANWFMEGLDLFERSKLSSRAHSRPLVISNVTTKKCNLTVLNWSSIYKSIIGKLNKMSSCQTRPMYSFTEWRHLTWLQWPISSWSQQIHFRNLDVPGDVKLRHSWILGKRHTEFIKYLSV